MTTLFDIGDEIEMTIKGKVKQFSVDRQGDCYVIELKYHYRDNKEEEKIPLYFDTKSLMAGNAHLVSER